MALIICRAESSGLKLPLASQIIPSKGFFDLGMRKTKNNNMDKDIVIDPKKYNF